MDLLYVRQWRTVPGRHVRADTWNATGYAPLIRLRSAPWGLARGFCLHSASVPWLADSPTGLGWKTPASVAITAVRLPVHVLIRLKFFNERLDRNAGRCARSGCRRIEEDVDRLNATVFEVRDVHAGNGRWPILGARPQ